LKNAGIGAVGSTCPPRCVKRSAGSLGAGRKYGGRASVSKLFVELVERHLKELEKELEKELGG